MALARLSLAGGLPLGGHLLLLPSGLWLVLTFGRCAPCVSPGDASLSSKHWGPCQPAIAAARPAAKLMANPWVSVSRQIEEHGTCGSLCLGHSWSLCKMTQIPVCPVIMGEHTKHEKCGNCMEKRKCPWLSSQSHHAKSSLLI